MSVLHKSRVREVASNKPNAYTAFQLSGTTEIGYKTFASSYTNGQTLPYFATNGIDWESGIGSFTTSTPRSIARTILLESSTGSAIDFSSGGNVNLFVSMPATTGQNVNTAVQSYISGLRITPMEGGGYGQYVRIQPGAAYIPDLDRVLTWDNYDSWDNMQWTSAWGQWSHFYLKQSSGSRGQIVPTTVGPGAPYAGTARGLSNQPNHRWLGCVYMKDDGTLRVFNHSVETGLCMYGGTGGQPPRTLSNGVSTSTVTFSNAAAIPPQSTLGFFRFINIVTSPTTAEVGFAKGGTADPYTNSTVKVLPVNPSYVDYFGPCPTNSLQQLSYRFNNTPTVGGAYCDVCGYYLER